MGKKNNTRETVSTYLFLWVVPRSLLPSANSYKTHTAGFNTQNV